nr:IPT/TIG domain-containing protein [uncultured Flavobacterium sp.]
MKKLLNNRISHLLFLSMMLIVTMLTSCNNEDDSNAAPVITEVRNYDAAPNDTLIETANTGQWVVIKGKNLRNVTSVTFGGTLAEINTSLMTDVSVVVQIPNIQYDLVPSEFHNEVRVVTKDEKVATYNFSSNILGSPMISRVRNYADSPNDTLVNMIVPGQKINLIGYNLQNVTEISFQGIKIDVANVVFTDSSAVVQVPEVEDFKDSNLAFKNSITYTTDFASTTLNIKIDIPITVDPFLKLLTGGVGPGKTWILDIDADRKSIYFNGVLLFAGKDIRWGKDCLSTPGGDPNPCFYYEPSGSLTDWMPGGGNYGSMTFTVGETGTIVKVDQKLIDTKGNYEGFYALNFEAKTLSFTGIEPLNVGWNSVDWSKAYVITLTENIMQLGFPHNNKPELEIYNYYAK